MGVAILIIGLILASAAINDKIGQLGALIKSDLFGDGKERGFIIWVAAIIILAAILKVLNLPEAGRALIALIIVSFFLGHTDVPGQILSSLQSASTEGGPVKDTSTINKNSPFAHIPDLTTGSQQ